MKVEFWIDWRIALFALALSPTCREATAQDVHSAITVAHRQGAVITGTVVDSLTGLPLHGVTVTITGAANFARQRVSDQLGRFRFDSLLPGKFSAQASHRLLDTARVTVRVAAADSAIVTIATRGRVAPPLLSKERLAQLASLDSARARWLGLRPAAYRFHVHTECFCFPAAPPPAVEVRGNAVTTVSADGTRHLVPPDSSKMFDIIGYFDFINSVIRDERMVVHGIEFDSTLGYPRKFTTESSQHVTDTWVHYFIEGFEVMERRNP